MRAKDYEPIKFEIFQSDMEKIMHFLDRVAKGESSESLSEWATKIKDDFQNKIDCHIEEGEWVVNVLSAEEYNG